ncbi:MAG TPA: DNA polymerase III subunit epsilon [Casimicrobiaceae bacterium]|jgi:DNA polymerase-3 subunit epsilon|nr:DNA polymerase III subunit epsilon [Casimicrobiaceae bacterium]
MRQIVLDTETTGLDPKQGHRIIEIAALEVIDRRPTGRYVHYYLNPEREIDPAATEVHGMTWEDLKDKPRFRDIVAELCDFLRGSEWVIHNAPFDVAFLDMELGLCNLPRCCEVHARVTDTLALAREQFPGKRNSLDALCERFGVDNAERTLHGALLDTRLLADVYLAMTRGQESLTIDIAPAASAIAGAAMAMGARPRGPLLVTLPTAEELEAHAAYLAALDKESKGRCLWLGIGAATEAAAA